jgi:prepilin-type N-terminal cleavage/methylation domain-containing protein
MWRRISLFDDSGHSLVEMLVVLVVLGLLFAAGGLALSRGIQSVEARGAAQAWQVAGTWAQLSAVWQGVATEVHFDSGRLAVRSDLEANGGDLGAAAPATPTVANVARWQLGDGVVVRFLAGTAYPNSAGSLYFRAPSGDNRVTVHLESGLTVRTRVEVAP